eukprot:m.232020 g.232020  ORF g.232020 m.232020 type:complete len:436 (+) comp16015_c0_seq3:390-1697(+)
MDLPADQTELLTKLELQNAAIFEDDRAPEELPESCPQSRQSISSNVSQEQDAPQKMPPVPILKEWGRALSTWDTFSKRNRKRLQELATLGIPSPIRGMVWQKLAEQAKSDRKVRESLTGETLYVELLEAPSQWARQINADIARTYPSHPFLAEKDGFGQQTLFNVIKAYSCYDSEVGYCQGSAFIAGLLLMYMPEEEAFNVFCVVMREFKLRGLFKPSMADLKLRLFQFEAMMGEMFPELHAHFMDMMLPTSSFASPWLLTLFGSTLPLPCVERIFDLFILDPNSQGLLTVFRAGLAILGMNHDALLRSNFENIFELLGRNGLGTSYINREEELVASIGKYNNVVTWKKLDKIEKDYKVKMEEETQKASELVRTREEKEKLQIENTRLHETVDALEEEARRLSQRLVEKSLSLSDALEEIEDLKCELENAKKTRV